MTRGSWPSRTTIVLTALFLQACAAGSEPANLDERRTVGDSGSVVVLGAGEEEHAIPFASRHCAAYGKVAEFKGMVTHRLSRYASTRDAEFICVRPSAPSDRFPGERH